MEKFVFDCLREISNAAQSIDKAVGKIIGWEFGSAQWGQRPPEYQDQPTTPSTNYIGNEFQEIVSEPAIVGKTVSEIIDEVKKLIIELKIKGSVREHRDGLLKFTSTVFGCVYGRTKEEIEEKLKEKIKQYKNKPSKANPQKKSPLLSEYFKTEWLPYKTKHGLSAHYIDQIQGYMRFIVKRRFDKPLPAYTSSMIENFLFSIPETSKRRTIQGLLNNMFTRAVSINLIKTNPCSAIERMQHKVEIGKAFSFDEQREFFETLFQSGELDYVQKCYFVFLYLTGARRAEALTVGVTDVDLKNKVLSIRGTKTEGSNRQIPLTPLVEKLLQSVKPKRGIYFSFADYEANRLFREVWSQEKQHKLHDLRHTFGTIQVCAQKIDIKTVSIWMGHSTTETTINIYTHPEQLDRSTFIRGDISNDEKTAVYREKYNSILMLIERFIKNTKR